MKSKKKSNSAPSGAAETSGGTGKGATGEVVPGLGLTERRRLVRPLPTPDVIEGDYDSDWAEFQALVSNDSQPVPKP
jgi:hypothetical protein